MVWLALEGEGMEDQVAMEAIDKDINSREMTVE
jgi:hypothetical protein